MRSNPAAAGSNKKGHLTVPSKEGHELRIVTDSINGQAEPNQEDAYLYFMQTLGVKKPQEEEDWSCSCLEGKDHVEFLFYRTNRQ